MASATYSPDIRRMDERMDIGALVRQTAEKLLARIAHSTEVKKSICDSAFRQWFRLQLVSGKITVQQLMIHPDFLNITQKYLRRKYPHLCDEKFRAHIDNQKLLTTVNESIAENLIEEGNISVRTLLDDVGVSQAATAILAEKYPSLGINKDFKQSKGLRERIEAAINKMLQEK